MGATKEKQRRPDAAREPRVAPTDAGLGSDGADAGARMARSQTNGSDQASDYDTKALFRAIRGGQAADAIRMAAFNPCAAMGDLRAGEPNESFDDADFLDPTAPGFFNPNADVEAFFNLVRCAKPYSSTTRNHLEVIFQGIGFPDQKRLIEAQFSIKLAAEGGIDFTPKELNDLYEQARQLPPSQTETNPSFVRLIRSKDAKAEGTYRESEHTVVMDAEKDPARYTQILRHEIGHAVDDRLGGTSAHLRLGEAGWKQYATVDEWIGALGGFGDIPAALRDTVKKSVQAYFGKGGEFKAPTAKFEDTLWAQLIAAHPGTVLPAEDNAPIVTDLNALRARYQSNMLLRACVASEGDNNYFRFAGWPARGDAVFFINHYYARGYSVSAATHANLKSWGNAAAAFSDKEWFAEIYAEWYSNGVGGKHFHFPDFITRFFQDVVETMGALDKGGGGDHPRVPRGG